MHQLLPRYEGARGDILAYNTIADKVNKIFKSNCKEMGLYFLDSGFKFPRVTETGAAKVMKIREQTLDQMGSTCLTWVKKNH